MVEWLGSWRRRPQAELRLGLRSVVAGVITFALGHVLGLPQVYWAVLTTVVVMQSSVGASLKATLDRLGGTLGGAVWGVVVSVAIPHAGIVSLGMALAVALVPLTLLAAFRPAYGVAPVTAIIVLLGSQSQQTGPVKFGVDRILEIGLGCLVTLVVALFVLPVRAHGLLAEAAGRALDVMAEHIVTLLEGLAAAPDPVVLEQLRNRSRDAVGRVEAVAAEAVRERAHHLTDAPDPGPLVRTLRRLRNDLTMVDRAMIEPLSEPVRSRLAGPAARASAEISTFLRTAHGALVGRTSPPSLDSVAQALDDYAAAMAEVRRLGLTHELSGEAVDRIFGLAFALEQLGENFKDLADRVCELGVQPEPMRR